jgi:DIX domain
VFLAPKPRQQGYPPTLLQIKQSFPLPGRYHFRFKAPLVPGGDREKGGLAVWMDCTDDRQPVPVWQAQIVAKITRIGVEEEDDDDEDDEDFRRPQVTAAVGVPLSQAHQKQQPSIHHQTTPPPAPVHAPSFDLFGDGPTSQAPAASNHVYSTNGSNMGTNLLDTPIAPTATSHGGASLLDMNYQQHPVQPPHSDFLGMTSAPSPPVSGNFVGFGGASQSQQRPPPQQQQARANPSFGSLSQGSGAFGDLAWK